MSLGEGVAARVAYKAYSTGAISSNSQPTSTADPAATGGQILRRTTCSINLAKDTYQSQEIVGHRQITDFRHGVKRVNGSIGGELSPGTYWDFIEAAMRGTEEAAVALTEVGLTSVAMDGTLSTITFGGGAPVTLGLRVGHILRFTNLATAANNSKNFLILGFSGASNRVLSVYPAPTTMSADSAFNVTTVGKRVWTPSSAHVSRKFGVEVYHSDLDLHQFFTECRVTGFNFALPATGLTTVEIPMMGRDTETATGASSPFFTAPTAATTTGLLAAVNGLVRVGGVTVGVITGGQVSVNLNPTSEPVVGQNYVPEIWLGRTNVTGQLTAFFEDLTLINYFKNETEVELLFYLLATTADASDAMSIYLPRNKFGDAQLGLQGEQGIPITMPFQSLLYNGVGAGIDLTTMAVCDTAAS